MHRPPQFLRSFDIAGIACGVQCGEPAFWGVLPERYEAFAVERTPELLLTVEVTDPPQADVATRAPGPYASVGVSDRVLSVEGAGFHGTFDTAAGRGQIRQPLDPAPFEAFLTAVYAWRLLEEGGFLLHAAGLAGPDGVAAFFGPSGSGKSTVAALVGEGVLSDEVLAITRGATGYRASGVPWRGRRLAGRLAALYALRKAGDTAFARLTPGIAARRLLSSVFFACADGAAVGRFLDTAARLLPIVPCYEMRFTADRSFWPRLPHRQPEEVQGVAL